MKALFLTLAAVFLVSCKGGGSDSKTGGSNSDSQSSDRTLSDRKPKTDTIVVIETNKGIIRAKLHPKIAPITVANFLEYVDEGFYDGTIFHRVMSDFMIQGGGFELAEGNIPKQKKPGPTIANESEFAQKNTVGTLAMARLPGADTASSQFFINVKDNPNLDFPNHGGGYAVFGEVIDGMDVVNQIKEVQTHRTSMLSLDMNGLWKARPSQAPTVPVDPVIIKSIRRASGTE